jgi:hypothetical protein
MKPNLSSIVNDLITGKAKLRSEYWTFSAAAGAAIGPEDFFECPDRTLRLILNGHINAGKTTPTTLFVWLYNRNGSEIAPLFQRTIGTDTVAFPTDDGSDKDVGEVSANIPLLMLPTDKLNIYHTFTALEPITDVVHIRYVEWTGVDVLR